MYFQCETGVFKFISISVVEGVLHVHADSKLAKPYYFNIHVHVQYPRN